MFSNGVILALGAALLLTSSCTADEKKHKVQLDEPCTLHSPNSGAFYDLRPLSLYPLVPGAKPHKEPRTESWQARGYDYPSNFTVNFCAPVIEDLEGREVVGLKHRGDSRNVSAYYESHGRIYSIGQESAAPIFRGRKLVLNYTNGSPCDERTRSFSRSPQLSDSDKTKGKPKHGDEDEDDYGDDSKNRKSSDVRRKSTIISLLCDRDTVSPKVALSFVGTSPDQCAYFFEARTAAACGGVGKEPEALGPGGVFAVIVIIALLVYLVGGCVYQRTVMHARGWRQLPNYSMWAGIGSYIRDIFIILTSSCSRLIPQTRGYRSVSTSGNGSARRGNRSEDENRLIDQLDEEWED